MENQITTDIVVMLKCLFLEMLLFQDKHKFYKRQRYSEKK